MSEVFEIPESLVKAEQGLNASMSDLTMSIQEVKKLATISGLFRSGPANLNSGISGNSGFRVGPKLV